ncbi:MAG: glycosyltransferase [Acidobacteriaceae bacterium]|nr:glycosyltransferase [Acidobacteriaceae bacterium]
MVNVVLAGMAGVEHVGAHLQDAASRLGIPLTFLNTEEAYEGNFVKRKFDWHFRGHLPTRLGWFSDRAITACQEGAAYLITTGLAPVERRALREIRKIGVTSANFLTDDPWSKSHRAPWFLKALPEYDIVFTPRRANIADLQAAGCRSVEYLPFAYAEDLHVPATRPATACDVFFAGGADSDRLPWIAALIRAGMDVGLYGGYWTGYGETRRCARGFVSPRQLNGLVAGARLCLCLVRKANRDGHAMRSFELAAMKACMLVERTAEHLCLFGTEGESVVYFTTTAEMLEKAHWLLSDPTERKRLAESAYRRITGGGQTYTDRLQHMLSKLNLKVLPRKLDTV